MTRNIKLTCAALVVLATLSLHTSPASAHLMPVDRGTMNLVGSKAYIVLGVPVAAFQDVPACQDGILSRREFTDHRPALRALVRDGLSVMGPKKATIKRVLLNLPTGMGHDPNAAKMITVMVVAHLSEPPKKVTLRWDLWARPSESLEVRTTVSQGMKTLQADIGTLTPDTPAYEFFGAGANIAANTESSPLKTLFRGRLWLIDVLIAALAACSWVWRFQRARRPKMA